MDCRKWEMGFGRCEHYSPIVVDEVEGGRVARCLLCGQSGPVLQGAEEALQALRDEARLPKKVSQSA